MGTGAAARSETQAAHHLAELDSLAHEIPYLATFHSHEMLSLSTLPSHSDRHGLGKTLSGSDLIV